MPDENLTPVAPALGVSFDFTLDEKRRVVVQTHLAADAPSEQIDALMDRVFLSLDRQEAKYKLQGLQRTLSDHEKILRQIVQDMGSIDTRLQAEWAQRGKRGDPKLSPKEESEKRNATSTRDRYVQEITKIKDEIAACEAKLKVEPKPK